MNFKKPKEQVAADAAQAAYVKIQYQLQQINNGNVGQVGYAVTQAVADGVGAAILSMMKDMYTDQEFEEDIGIGDRDELK
jgi:hypothetical protein